MSPEDIEGILDAIHDRWFSVDDIEYDPAARTWSVPFSADSTMRPPHARSLKGVAGTKVLEISGVDSFELTDTEKIGWYMFNVLKYRPADGILEIVSCFPLGLRLHVSSPEVQVVEQK